METFTTKVGSRRKPLRATLSDAAGVINLTGALQVNLILEHMRTGATTTLQCTVESPASGGIVRYDWSAADLDGILAAVGQYRAEFKITWAANDPQRVPSDGFFTVQIIRNAEM